jgi:HTH-type transcriptional repressor of NAD biosynthesis genes
LKKGLVLGKFMPLHKGHLALFDFALRQCDQLFILLCYTKNERINGKLREEWLLTAVKDLPGCKVVSFLYDENELPNTSVSSKEVSLLWSRVINNILPAIDVVISSECYGDYLADFLHIKHSMFDMQRINIPVSASAILTNPLVNWDFIAAPAQSYFIKKIVLLGTESTGKSTLAEKLAAYFNASYVPEMARQILEKTIECKPVHLIRIAELHAKEIVKVIETAKRLVFIDTDINITKSYATYLFKETLFVEQWIEAINKADLYLFLEPDCPHVQDGTRLSEEERNELSFFHKKQLEQVGISYFSISGNWDERFEKACSIVKDHFNL